MVERKPSLCAFHYGVGDVFGRAERLITCGGTRQMVTVVCGCQAQRTVTFGGSQSGDMLLPVRTTSEGGRDPSGNVDH